MHSNQILIGLFCPAMEFHLFPDGNGKSRCGFKAELTWWDWTSRNHSVSVRERIFSYKFMVRWWKSARGSRTIKEVN